MIVFLIVLIGCGFLVFRKDLRKYFGQKGPVEFQESKLCWDLETPFAVNIPKEIFEIFSDTFTYLGHGNQSIVFEDPSETHVLKIFLRQRLKGPKIYPQISLDNLIPLHRDKRNQKKERSLRNALKAYDEVFQNHPEIAALEAAHLSKCDCGIPKVTVTDASKKTFSLDLNRLCFVIQKKANLVYPCLTALSIEERKELLKAMESFLVKKAQLGYIDRETMLHMHSNYGYVNKTPIQLDVGRLKFDPDAMNSCLEESRLVELFSLWKKSDSQIDL